MPARVRQQSDDDRIKALISRVGHIFNEVSNNPATHVKNNVTLWKLHQDLSKIREILPRSVRIMGEKAFQKEIQYMLSMVLVAKKGTTQADRTIKFVAGYVRYTNEKAYDPEEGTDEDIFNDEDNNPASRLTKSLLDWLLGGFLAKDKTIRYRVTQTVAQMVSHLGAIDEDQYLRLRASLIGRLDDKDSSVRLQAVVALSKLSGTEGEDDVESEDSILSRLLKTMSEDPSSEVRRAALANMLIFEDTFDPILERTRDTEVSVRKLVYGPVFSSNLVQGDEKNVVGPSHPRAFSIAQKEVIVRNGLGDRDDAVRKVAASLLGSWVDYAQVGLEVAIPEEDQRIETNVLLFLKFFDLDSEEGKVAADALKGIFGSRVKIFDTLDFDDKYFTKLTPEKAFLIRVFVDVCKEQDKSARLEAAVPAINQIVVRLGESHNAFIGLVPPELLANLPEEEFLEREEQYTAEKIVLRELLKLAVNLDYSDELGRRMMNTLAYTMIRQNSLPTDLMGPCLALMRVLALSEPDLVRQMVEIIQEIRDAAYGEIEEPMADLADGEVQQPAPRKSLDKMNDEERAKVEETEMRCLSLCISMLEQVDSPIAQNATLGAILENLVLPSVTSTKGSDINKELALKALGLFCLIVKPLARNTVPVLIENIHKASHRHKLIMIQILFDILMIHEWTVVDDEEERIRSMTTFLLDNIKQEQDPAVKALFCKGTAKLILSGLITDVDAVKNLIKAYVSPATLDNQELRQCLAYFLPIYSQSSAPNQRRTREMFIHVFLDICQDRKEAEEDEEDDIVSSSQIADMFLMWTDPTGLSEAITLTGGQDIGEQELGVQLDLAEDVLRTLFEKDLKVTIEKEDKRVLVHLLNKIQLPDVVDDFKIKSIKLLIDHLRSRRPLRDSVCNTALKKFESAIIKKFEKQLENINEDEIRELAELNDLFAFLDSIIPLDDDEFSDVELGMKGKKRRSESVLTSNETEDESFNGTPPPGKEKGKRKAKRARFSTSDGGEDDVATPHGTPPPEKKTRTVPKRAVAGKKKVQPIILPGDEDEDQEVTPGPSRRPTKARAQSEEDEEELDRDLSGLLAPPTVASTSSTASTGTFDSIMDDDEDEDDEEAEEVQDLLAAD